MERLTTLPQALAEIEREATTGDSILQAGAAFALAALAEAGGAGPGWKIDDLARSLMAKPDDGLVKVLIDQAREGDEAVAALARVGSLARSALRRATTDGEVDMLHPVDVLRAIGDEA
jgi:hypothetical protein